MNTISAKAVLACELLRITHAARWRRATRTWRSRTSSVWGAIRCVSPSRSTRSVLTVPIFMSPWAKRLQRLPLCRGEHAAQSQQHSRVCLLQFSARLRDLVDLRQDARLVRLIRRQQWLQDRLFLLHRCMFVNQLEPALLKDVVHLLLLVGTQTHLLRNLRIVPPASVRPHAKGALHRWATRRHRAAVRRPIHAGPLHRCRGRRWWRVRCYLLRRKWQSTRQQRRGSTPVHQPCLQYLPHSVSFSLFSFYPANSHIPR